MDPGWVVHGWEMEKSQKRKTQNTPNGWALDSEPTAGRVGRSLAYPEERALPGHFAPCLPPGVGLGQAGLWQPPESILLKLPLPHSSPCSIPEQVWPAQAAPALVPLETQCPGFTQILRHSHRLCQLSEVTIRHTRNNVLTEQKGCTYPLHPAFWGCPGISRPLQRHCSGW